MTWKQLPHQLWHAVYPDYPWYLFQNKLQTAFPLTPSLDPPMFWLDLPIQTDVHTNPKLSEHKFTFYVFPIHIDGENRANNSWSYCKMQMGVQEEKIFSLVIMTAQKWQFELCRLQPF